MLVASAVLCCSGAAEARVTRYLTGNPADVSPPLFGPAHDLGGGGSDVDAAIQWLIDEVRGCTDCAATLDVVVLRASGSNGYNDYIYGMRGVDSVETLVITSPSDSNRANVRGAVQQAEIVFFAGGDQCDYVRNFKGTAVETAVESLYARGGGVGGTSAGLAIQGEYIYDACTGSVTSGQALANPYHPQHQLQLRLLRLEPTSSDTITDTHFVARDRMGRTLAFLARQIQDGRHGGRAGGGGERGHVGRRRCGWTGHRDGSRAGLLRAAPTTRPRPAVPARRSAIPTSRSGSGCRERRST